MLWYMFKWTIHESTHGAFPKPEFEEVMHRFVEFFYNNVEKINGKTIKSTFDDDAVMDFETRPYKMLNWKQYGTYKMSDKPKRRNKPNGHGDLWFVFWNADACSTVSSSSATILMMNLVIGA